MRVSVPQTTHERTTISLPILLGGVALGVSFPPNAFGPLAWIAFLPLLYRWDDANHPRDVLSEAYTAFLVAYALAFFWPLLTAYPQTLVLSLGGLLLIPLLLAVPFAVSLPIRHRLGRGWGLLALLAAYLTVEGVLQHGPLPFPWSTLGYTQANLLPLAQMVEFTGVTGLSLWVLVINVLLFLTLMSSPRRRQVGFAVVTVAFVSASWLGGRWVQDHQPETHRYVSAGLIQPGLEPGFWKDNEVQRLTRLIQLSDSLVASMGMPPTFLIWPGPMSESRRVAAPRQRFLTIMQQWASQLQAPLLLGTKLQADPGGRPAQHARFNSAVLLSPDQHVQRYDQVDLVPFAEQVPLAQHLPWMGSLFHASASTSQLRPGTSRQLLSHDGLSVGVLIGFEALLNTPARALATQRADFFVAMTHDAWWGRAPGYRQHLAFVRLRAIEARTAVVQVTRSGSTAVIAPDGTTIHAVDPEASLSRLVAIPLSGDLTFYTRAGDWLSLLALTIAGLFGTWWFLLGRRALTRTRRPAPSGPAAYRREHTTLGKMVKERR